MSENFEPCPVCDGRGYLRCACWPGDCICGEDNRDCEACFGTGEADEDDGWHPGIECEHGYDACPICDSSHAK